MSHTVNDTMMTMSTTHMAQSSPASTTQTTKVSRAKTNSERGKAFRARQRRHEEGLQNQIWNLRRAIADLDAQRSIWQARHFNTRSAPHGSLARLVREYRSLFRHGLADTLTLTTHHDPRTVADRVTQATYQENSVRQVMDPSVKVGELVGPEPLIDQWRRYTTAHSHLTTELGQILVVGPDENPTVVLQYQLRVKLAHSTFQLMFPHAMTDEELLKAFLHKNVVYDCVARFRFTPDGRICHEEVDVGFIDGLLRAGCSLSDIAKLMQLSVLSKHCTIGDSDETGTNSTPRDTTTTESHPLATVDDEIMEEAPRISSPSTQSDNSKDDSRERRLSDVDKLSMRFLLVDDDGHVAPQA